MADRVAAIGVYKYMMRSVQRLPPAAQQYYRNHARSNFAIYKEIVENDPSRLPELLAKARHDTAWVLQKVNDCLIPSNG